MSDLPADRPPADLVAEDGWAALRRHTPARIALGRTGVSQPTRAVLGFGLAHAQARDAVHAPLDVDALREQLLAQGWPDIRVVRSRATDRAMYLARPDLGRQLDDESLAHLGDAAQGAGIVFVIGDGLSSTAVAKHAAAFVSAARDAIGAERIGPLVIATQARVALADAAGQLLGARIAVSVIGERPGLSTPDSLGVYVTWDPRPGRSDAERNCISNIHGAGLSYAEGARQLAELVRIALTARGTGVRLEAVKREALAGGGGATPGASTPA